MKTILGFGGTLTISKPHLSRTNLNFDGNVTTVTFTPDNNSGWGISKEIPYSFVYTRKFGKDFSNEAKMMIGVI